MFPPRYFTRSHVLANLELEDQFYEINNSIFYKKMTLQDIKNIYNIKLDEKNFNINKYKDYITKLNKSYKKLEYQLNIINEKYNKLKYD